MCERPSGRKQQTVRKKAPHDHIEPGFRFVPPHFKHLGSFMSLFPSGPSNAATRGRMFVVLGWNDWQRSTARQTFEPECVIVFCFRDQGPSDNQRTLFSERFTDCHSQASARHGIEWRQRIGRGVDLWLIAVLWLIAQHSSIPNSVWGNTPPWDLGYSKLERKFIKTQNSFQAITCVSLGYYR